MIRGRRIAITILTGVITLGIVVFIISRTYGYLIGPKVVNSTLDSITYLDTYSIIYEARTKNTEIAMINGHKLPIRDDNTIHYVLALVPGANNIELILIDSYQKKQTYYYTIITPHLSKINDEGDTYEQRNQANQLPIN